MKSNSMLALRGAIAVGLAAIMLLLVTSPRAQAATLPLTVSVPATAGTDPSGNFNYFEPGVTLVGQTIRITASGTWHACDQINYSAGCTSGPEGTSAFPLNFQPMPTEIAGTLVARIGSGPWTRIGVGPVDLIGTGVLQFADNDGLDYSDNTGSVTATIIDITGAPTVGGPSPTIQAGVAYSSTLTATGGVGPYTYSSIAGSLPTGLTLHADGTITGTPGVAGTFSFTVQAVDARGNAAGTSAPLVVTLVVAPAASGAGVPSTASPTSPYLTGITLTAGQTYSITASGSWNACDPLSQGSSCTSDPNGASGFGTGFAQPLPGSFAGVLLARVGSGPWIVVGSGPVEVSGVGALVLINNDGYWDDNSGFIPVNIVNTTPATPMTLAAPAAAGQVGVAYSSTAVASNATGAVTYSISAGSLPAGLSLNSSTGAITGTPSSAGTSTFTVQGVDSGSHTATVNVTLVISPAAVSGVGVPAAIDPLVVTPYSSGITLAPGETYSVTPLSTGTWQVCDPLVLLDPGCTTNAAGNPGYGPFGALRILPTAQAGAMIARVGSGPWVVIGNTTTTVSGTGLLVLAANDLTGYYYDNTGFIPVTIVNTTVVVAPTSVAYTGPSSVSNGGSLIATNTTTGIPDGQTVTISLPGGQQCTATITSNAASCSIVGVSQPVGPATLTVTYVGDSTHAPSSTTASVTISAAPLPMTLAAPAASGQVGVPYSSTAVASNAVGAVTYSISVGSLPAGLSLNPSTGAITGTPSSAGTFTFTVQGVDSGSHTATVNVTLVIAPAVSGIGVPAAIDPLVVTPYSSGIVIAPGETYSVTPLSTGTWQVCDPLVLLDPGCTTNADGNPGYGPFGALRILPTAQAGAMIARVGSGPWVVIGNTTTTVSGTGLLVLAANDLTGYYYDNTGFIPVTIVNTTVAAAPTSVAYTGATTVANGSSLAVSATTTGIPNGGTVTFSLPGGQQCVATVTSNFASCSISGVSQPVGPATLTVTYAGDSTHAPSSTTASVAVSAAPVALSLTGPAASGTVGTPYSSAFAAAGGSGGYTYSIVGTLPGGLTLNPSTGALTGTPTAAGTFTFTGKVTDGASGVATVAVTITIVAAPPPVTPADVCSHADGNIVVNGCFESNPVTTGAGWDTFQSPPLTGWSVTWLNPAACLAGEVGYGAGQLELQRGILGPEYEGQQHAELDSDCNNGTNDARNGEPGSVRISQSLATTAGTAYKLRFAYKSRPGTDPATNGVRVLWNGVQVALVGDAADWTVVTVTVTATGASSVLAIEDAGTSDSLGSFLDDVRVTPLSAPTLTGPTTTGIVGTPYTSALVAAGGTGPTYTYSLQSGALPGGLTLNASTGAITGTPTTVGAFPFVGKVVDSAGVSATVNVTITISAAAVPLSLTGPTTTGTVGTPYTSALVAAGGTGPTYTYSLQSGALPGGLTLNPATGAITGTPTTAGTFTFVGKVIDSASGSATVNVTITISAAAVPLSLAAPTATGTVGTPYSSALVSTGGTGPTYTYSLQSGALPGGLALNPVTGAITGTPTTAGTFTFVGKVVDSGAHIATVNATITISAAAPLHIVLSTNACMVVEVQASSATYVSKIRRTVPTPLTELGVTNKQTGVIARLGSFATGTELVFGIHVNDTNKDFVMGLASANADGKVHALVTALGTNQWRVNFEDLYGAGDNDYNDAIFIVRPGDCPATPPTLTGPATTGTVGTPYTSALVAAGGTPVYTYSLQSGALPGGLALNPATGAITGTPTAAGTFNIVGKVVDSTSQSATVSATITISAASVSYAVCAEVGDSHDDNRNGSSGHSAQSGSTLPIRLQICDASGHVLTSRSLVVKAVSVTTGVLADAGNSNPGNLFKPVGTDEWQFNLNTAGYAPGNYTLDFTVGTSSTVLHYAFTIRPVDVPLSLTDAAPDGKVGVVYTGSVTATGGVAPYVYTKTAGSLPGGLTLNASTGALTGTPTTAGTFTFTVKATGSSGTSDTESVTVKIEALPAVSLTAPDGTGKLGLAYTQTLTSTGGNGGPYTYTKTSGTLPGGLTLSAAGVISGTPTATGTFTFTVKAADSLGNSDSEEMKIKVEALPAVKLTASDKTGKVGTAFSATVTATGGTGGPYTFTVTSGPLPGGLTLNASTGVISGTPTVAGTFNLTLKATDSLGNNDTETMKITISAH